MIENHFLKLLFINIVIMSPYFAHNIKQAIIGIIILIILGLSNKFLYLLILVCSIIINIFYFHVMLHWGSNAIGSRVQAALESPTYERMEYLKAYLSAYDFLIFIYILISSLLIIQFMKHQKEINLYRSKKVLTLLIAIFLIIIAIPANPSTLKTLQLIELPLLTFRAHERLDLINIRSQYLSSLKLDKTNCSNLYDKIIIVQGEAVNKNHMAIYGYNKNTTPFLSSLAINKFDAISPTNQTRYSIPIEFTKARVHDYQSFFNSESIVTSLKECGYSTYWISNQGRRGHHDTSVTSIANEAEHIYFLNELNYQTAGYDEKILNVLNSLETKNKNKQAFFIHLIGSHVSYDKRYPFNNMMFKSNTIVDNYDNSVYYTDYILSKIYEKFPKESSLYIYLSDHGEVVTNTKHGHGYFPSFTDEYDIPFVIWGKREERVVKLVEHSKGKIINTESFNNIVEYLIGKNNDLNISYSQDVFSLQPNNIIKYNKLIYFNPVK